MLSMQGLFVATWNLFAMSAPGLIVGFLASGIISVVIPSGFIIRHLREPGLLSVLKAAILGIPLPLCSCSVIPVGISLREKGASRGATASFFVSTPEIGVDSFILSWVLLGPAVAFARVATTFLSALSVGVGVDRWGGDITKAKQVVVSKPCCGSNNHTQEDQATQQNLGDKKDCCAVLNNNDRTSPISRCFRYAFVTMVDDLATLLIMGFVLAGCFTYFIPDDFVSNLNVSQTWSMILMLLISLPTYVCSLSSTPLAAAMLSKGVDPGSVLVFLLAGPATNITTIMAINRELGLKSCLIYIFGIAGVSLVAGSVLSFVFKSGNFLGAHAHSHAQSAFETICALTLAGLLLLSVYRRMRSNKPRKK